MSCLDTRHSRPDVIKRFSCSTQLSRKLVLLIINLKLLTIANSFLLNIAGHDFFFSVNKYENDNYKISCSAELSLKKSIITSVLSFLRLK